MTDTPGSRRPSSGEVEIRRLLDELTLIEHRKHGTIDDWVREKNAIRYAILDRFAAQHAASVAATEQRLAGRAEPELVEMLRELVDADYGVSIIESEGATRAAMQQARTVRDEKRNAVLAHVTAMSAALRASEEAKEKAVNMLSVFTGAAVYGCKHNHYYKCNCAVEAARRLIAALSPPPSPTTEAPE